MSSNLKIDFLGVSFDNPLVLPSGMINEVSAHKRAEERRNGFKTA